MMASDKTGIAAGAAQIDGTVMPIAGALHKNIGIG